MKEPIRLTSLAHGGGCGCKLAPSVLQKMLINHPGPDAFPSLLVGTQNRDDAAVYKLDENTGIISSTDFFMPMVDDPYTFGQIAAANAISDIYAMGGKPIMALAILGMPIDKMSTDTIAVILQGGQDKAAEANIPVAGGHSIDCPEPVYGLAVTGICENKNLRRNDTAKAGDVLLLLKGLGVGIYSAAFKKGLLDEEGYKEMVASMTQLNKIGMELAQDPDIHAMTDVTGFGILGHALEVAQGSNLEACINFSTLPFLAQTETLAKAGFITGASKRNFASYGEHIILSDDMPEYQRHMLSDPQTSGGLLLSVNEKAATRIVKLAIERGYLHACIIGHMQEGRTCVKVQ